MLTAIIGSRICGVLVLILTILPFMSLAGKHGNEAIDYTLHVYSLRLH